MTPKPSSEHATINVMLIRGGLGSQFVCAPRARAAHPARARGARYFEQGAARPQQKPRGLAGLICWPASSRWSWVCDLAFLTPDRYELCNLSGVATGHAMAVGAERILGGCLCIMHLGTS